MDEKRIWVNRDRMKDTHEKSGIDFTVHLSPYDMPREIVGSFEERSEEFTIAFQYIDDEPEKLAATDKETGIRLYQGKHSGKLLRIVVPVNKHPLDSTAVIQLQTAVLGAIRVSPDEQRFGRRMNRRVAEDLLERDFHELAGVIPG